MDLYEEGFLFRPGYKQESIEEEIKYFEGYKNSVQNLCAEGGFRIPKGPVRISGDVLACDKFSNDGPSITFVDLNEPYQEHVICPIISYDKFFFKAEDDLLVLVKTSRTNYRYSF